MTAVRKRTLRSLAAMALSGSPETNDAGLVLSHTVEQLKVNIYTLVSALEQGGMDRADLQAHLIGLQYRVEALGNFADECLHVSFLPLSDEDDEERPEVPS